MKKVFSAMVTPLLADGALDKKGLRNILDRGARHGIDGVFLLGSMGEWGSFDVDFKEELVKESVAAAAGRLEILAGINATSLPLSLKQMERWSKYAVDNYVFMLPARTSFRDPVKSILAVLDAADRPVYYYHCPPNNGIRLSLDQFAAIMQHPNLKGIKNSASDMCLRRELIYLKRERGFQTLLLEGQEWAVDEALIVGYDGMLCGMGALASRIMVGIARAVDRMDIPEAVRLQNVFLGIFHGVYGINLSTIMSGQKYALAKLGIIETPYTVAEEMDLLTPAVRERIEKCLVEYRGELD